MYENVEDHFDTIEDRYDANYDHYCDWYVDRNEKNLNTQEQVDEFMSAKEDRNKEYIQQLKESETQEYVGDEFGLLHPVVAHYQE
jgi:lysine/ornithine N-monooxygenase